MGEHDDSGTGGTGAGWADAPGGWSTPGGSAPGGSAPGGNVGASPTGWGARPQQPPAAPGLRPGIVPLRPLSLGEIYDGAFQALRTNPRTMLGMTAVVVTVMAVVDLLVSLFAADSLTTLTGLTDPGREVTSADLDVVFGSLEVLGVGLVVSTVASLIGLSVVTGLLTFAVSQAVLGRRVPLGELWQRTRGRLLPLVGLTLLVGLALVAAMVVPVVPGVVVLAFSTPLGVGLLLLGLLAGLGAFLWLYGRLALVAPALLLEDQGVLGAWRRSWALSRGSFWRVLGIVVLTVVITMITVTIVSAPFAGGSLVISVVSGDDPAAAAGVAPAQLVLQAVGDVVARTIVYPFTAAVTALLYIDLRMRREGLDVQLARAATRDHPAADGPPGA